jgi:hypothetical protein
MTDQEIALCLRHGIKVHPELTPGGATMGDVIERLIIEQQIRRWNLR